MNRDWGRDVEQLLRQHGHGRGRRGEDDWGGPWGSGMWGPPPRRGGGRGGPPPWLAGLFGLAQQERANAPRARRGDVRMAILAVLADGPLNGYQVIQEISDRAGGSWRPSPGSIYPTISQLEDEGLVARDEQSGRRTLELTDAGRTFLDEHQDEVAQVWAPFVDGPEQDADDESPRGSGSRDFTSLKPELGRVMNAVWQIITTGTDEQRRSAIGVLVEARRSLYQILADHPGDLDERDDLGDRPVRGDEEE